MKFLEEKFMPFAAKMGQQKHLAAIRDAFALVMPFIIAGAFAVLLNNVVFKTDVDYSLFKLFAPNANGTFFTDTYIVPVMVLIWQGSFAVMALLVSYGIGYYLATSRGASNPVFAGLVSTVTLLMLATWSVDASVAVQKGVAVAYDATTMATVTPTKIATFALDPASLGATGLFATIIFGLLSTEIYCKLSKVKSFEIKMPASVPPAVSKSFAALVPGMLTLITIGIIGVLVTKLTGQLSVFSAVSTWIQEPFMSFANSKGAGLVIALVYVFFVHLLWSFGIHGTNVMNGIFAAVWTPMIVQNVSIYKTTHNVNAPGLSTFAQPFFDTFVFLGGAGATIALLIAIFWTSKREDEKTIAKLAIAPGIFQINEPVIFGMPIVLNPVYLIPFVLIPVINTIIGWAAIDVIHFAPKFVAMVPWTTPPVIGAFLASGLHWQSAVVAALILVLDIAIYIPFVKSSTKKYLEEQEAKNENKVDTLKA